MHIIRSEKLEVAPVKQGRTEWKNRRTVLVVHRDGTFEVVVYRQDRSSVLNLSGSTGAR